MFAGTNVVRARLCVVRWRATFLHCSNIFVLSICVYGTVSLVEPPLWLGLFLRQCRYNTPYEEEATSILACFAKLLRSLDWIERQRIGELDAELAKASSA